jgi:hypothetical protein
LPELTLTTLHSWLKLQGPNPKKNMVYVCMGPYAEVYNHQQEESAEKAKVYFNSQNSPFCVKSVCG